MEDLSSIQVGETITGIEKDEDSEYTVVEKETSSTGKIQAVIVEPVDGGEGERRRIPQSEWGDTWTA